MDRRWRQFLAAALAQCRAVLTGQGRRLCPGRACCVGKGLPPLSGRGVPHWTVSAVASASRALPARTVAQGDFQRDHPSMPVTRPWPPFADVSADLPTDYPTRVFSSTRIMPVRSMSRKRFASSTAAAISGEFNAAFISSSLANHSSPMPSQTGSVGAELTRFWTYLVRPGCLPTIAMCCSPPHWARHCSRVRSARRYRMKITLAMGILLHSDGIAPICFRNTVMSQ
jgi:hypothetical protein